MADYIIQKAVAPDKVVKANRRTLEDYGRTFDAQRKYDGCCAVLHIGYCYDIAKAYSRTGEVAQSMLPICDILNRDLGTTLVLIGEAWWPGKDQFNLISGEFRRHSRSDRLLFALTDALFPGEFQAGRSEVPYSRRMERVGPSGGERWFKAESWEAGTYGCPQELCNTLVDQGGYDGLILRDPNGTWTRGRGTTGEIVKIKRELSFDLRVLEVNTAVGEKTGRTVYKLVVDFGGLRLGVGSGLPHTASEVPKVGDIVEVVAMDHSSDGLLREPRFKGIRHDKLEPDAA